MRMCDSPTSCGVHLSSGGNLRGINGNGYFFVRLPASGLEFDMPIIGNFAETPQPDQGVMPHVRIARSIADLSAGRDTPKSAAKAWVASV